MKIADLVSKWKELVEKMNDKGIPLPMIRDPQSLEGSVSLTLVVMSSALVVIGILSKWAGLLGGIDMNSAFNFFYASTTLYFGHNWINKDTKTDEAKPAAPASKPQPKADNPDA